MAIPGQDVAALQIIVQGSAFCQASWGDISQEEYKEIIKVSAGEGYRILRDGGSAVDAVEAAVRVLEDNEYFNAGYGSTLNNDGEVECNAMIMDGSSLNTDSFCGLIEAVISGRYFRNPVSLAKKIMNDTQYCALSGEGALNYAIEQGFPTCGPNQLITQRQRNSQIRYLGFNDYIPLGLPVTPTDTVSAVARDANGRLACAVSTGGIAGSLKGRVSDAAMVGCGGYANEHGAATTSGQGEYLMKMTLAREVVYMMESGMNAQEAAENALRKMQNKFQQSGLGGVIAIDKDGNVGKACTTDYMGWASVNGDRMANGLNPQMEVRTLSL
ncbi:isoaspartyl peptidase/L-asparaginase-like [Dendronephthya gigantea]|uniref:isoaspartyl peptidase/L-asparaginase-like n=1 Tax=Dendronephthya gigantea TaxID=151771 RepID=UPI00106BBDF9|nr:isoaspartyl peptidase/L-asparaginase-like [Dendronephthya gigantea]